MVANLLRNPNYASNVSGVATGWTSEYNGAIAPTYSIVTAGAIGNGQRIQYVGQTGDSARHVEIYSDSTAFAPGDTATFVVWLSGTITGATGPAVPAIGLESFNNSGFISGISVGPQNLLPNVPQPFLAVYPNLPATTNDVAVFMEGFLLSSDCNVDLVCSNPILVNGLLPASLLIDFFPSTVINATQWANTNFSANYAVNNGLILKTDAGGDFVRFTSQTTYNLTGSQFSAELRTVGAPPAQAFNIFHAIKDATNELKITVTSDGFLVANKVIAGTSTQLFGGTYNAAIHRFFRIRESAGTCYFDYSQNGTSGKGWVNFASVANPFAITSMSMALELGGGATVTSSQWNNVGFAPPTGFGAML